SAMTGNTPCYCLPRKAAASIVLFDRHRVRIRHRHRWHSWTMLSPTCPTFFVMESIVSYFSGMRVLITGAGSGIGALMAEKLAKQGAEVLVSARRMEAANQVVERIHTDGGRAFPVLLDVS